MRPKDDDGTKVSKGDMLLGIVVLGTLSLGVLGVVMAVVAWSHKDWGGGGLCLVAAAIAFGAMLNVVAKHMS
jgi:hypothetical protein